MKLSLAGWSSGRDNTITQNVDNDTRRSIHQYPDGSGCAGRFCAQVWRNGFGLSAVLNTFEEALSFTTDHLESHIAIFNRLCANELIEEIQERQKKLIALGCAETINGYEAGYVAGRASAFADLRKAIPELDPSEQEAA